MKIETLSCANFRNIENIDIFPCDEMNIICGKNANGKTNLIEAIWLFTGAKSFRTSKDSDLIKFNCKEAVIKTEYFSEEIKKDAKIEISDKRKFYKNNFILSNSSEFIGEINEIIFSPLDLEIITGAPIKRRNFLDVAICKIYPAYLNVIKDYKRAITQRNKSLKNYKFDSTVDIMLDVFEKEIAEKAKKIIIARNKFLSRLEKYLCEIYFGISEKKENLTIKYFCICPPDILETKLKESRKADMITGITSIGPHRDDIIFNINNVNSRIYGSQGQKRSIALVLKLSEAEVSKEITGEYPICLLDDVMSELDPSRQNYVLNHIKGWQSFLTCCDPSNIINLKNGKIFNIENGRVRN